MTYFDYVTMKDCFNLLRYTVYVIVYYSWQNMMRKEWYIKIISNTTTQYLYCCFQISLHDTHIHSYHHHYDNNNFFYIIYKITRIICKHRSASINLWFRYCDLEMETIMSIIRFIKQPFFSNNTKLNRI